MRHAQRLDEGNVVDARLLHRAPDVVHDHLHHAPQRAVHWEARLVLVEPIPPLDEHVAQRLLEARHVGVAVRSARREDQLPVLSHVELGRDMRRRRIGVRRRRRHGGCYIRAVRVRAILLAEAGGGRGP
eukprot:4377897-Prymnesium_polylepis.1